MDFICFLAVILEVSSKMIFFVKINYHARHKIKVLLPCRVCYFRWLNSAPNSDDIYSVFIKCNQLSFGTASKKVFADYSEMI